MTPQLKSIIRHALTAVGTLLLLLGLNSFIPVIDFLKDNLEPVWDAIVILMGFVTTLIGFFTDKGERFKTAETTTDPA